MVNVFYLLAALPLYLSDPLVYRTLTQLSGLAVCCMVDIIFLILKCLVSSTNSSIEFSFHWKSVKSVSDNGQVLCAVRYLHCTDHYSSICFRFL